MLAAGVDCRRIIRDPSVQTALAVLPIFSAGERGCFVNLAANDHLTGSEVANVLRDLTATDDPPVAALHYGYPHFTKQVGVVSNMEEPARVARIAVIVTRNFLNVAAHNVGRRMGDFACHLA